MAKKTTKSTVTEDVTMVEVSLTDLKVGDKIYLDPRYSELSGYTVLDVGNPFILIEDSAHFANLYRVTKPLYKKID